MDNDGCMLYLCTELIAKIAKMKSQHSGDKRSDWCDDDADNDTDDDDEPTK